MSGGGHWGANNNLDKTKMHVPDRIIVAGHGRHVGVPALPRELELDSAVGMPPDPLTTKIHTPPRSIIVTESYTSGVRSDPSSQHTSDEEEELLPSDSGYLPLTKFQNNYSLNKTAIESPNKSDVFRSGETPVDRRIIENNTMGLGAYEEEVEHLRDQLSRVNRRVMILEEEMNERKDKERYLVIAGILYAAVKAVNWLFRSRR